MAEQKFTVDAHVAERLRTEPLIWLSSVRSDQRPHLVPVWFLWNGEDEILIFSQPENQKIRNMRQNNRVVLALEALKGGDDVVLLDGRAEIITDPEVKATMAAYVEKYGARLQEMNWKIEDMAQSYSQAIRITLTHIKSWNE